MRPRPSASAALLSVLASTACQHGPDVARLVDGRAIDGRDVPPEAYAEFLQGVLAEESFDRGAARDAYIRALRVDGGAAGLWARLGAVTCLTRRSESDAAFGRAHRLAADLADAWLADAECALERGAAGRALRAAMRAASLNPLDLETSLVVERALVRAGDVERARLWRHARSLRSPSGACASVATDVGAALACADERARSPSLAFPGPAADVRTALGALDVALSRGDDAEARRLATTARIGLAELSLRAVDAGRLDLAQGAVSHALAADPSDADAQIGALAVADLLRDDAAFARALRPSVESLGAPSALGARLLSELLARRSGAAASGLPPGPGSADRPPAHGASEGNVKSMATVSPATIFTR